MMLNYSAHYCGIMFVCFIIAYSDCKSNRLQLKDSNQKCAEWVVEIEGGLDDALQVASIMKSELIGKVSNEFGAYYILNKCVNAVDISENNKIDGHVDDILKILEELKYVLFIEKQHSIMRYQRFDSVTPKRQTCAQDIFVGSIDKPMFNDPLFPYQWQLQEIYRKNVGRVDHKILDAWRLGYSGNGVVLAVIDDGVDRTHDDLKDNFDDSISFNLSNHNRTFSSSSHGTKCAGIISMSANNGKCGVGIAYNARIGGIGVLDRGFVNDRKEAQALVHGISSIDIKSISWGPKDDGRTVEGPSHLARLALQKSAEKGRQSLGTVFVWASGNGGLFDDNCACDGYVGSIMSFAVSAMMLDGSIPWFAEKCAATLVSAYSSGAFDDTVTVTIDVSNTCSLNHTGTSAAVPIVAGIIALGIEANKNLTWRDIQHLAIWTADPTPNIVSSDPLNKAWRMNDAGLLYHPYLGFGLMQALAFVEEAKKWRSVPPQQQCINHYNNFEPRVVRNNEEKLILLGTHGCAENENKTVHLLEHILLILNITAARRGNIEISLQSPRGTLSELLNARKFDDDSVEGYRQWPFTSVHYWGETPQGVWTLRLRNIATATTSAQPFTLDYVSLVLFGTRTAPYHYTLPKVYRN